MTNKYRRMSVKKILSMDIEEFNKLTKEDLEIINSKMAVQTNRRTKTLIKHNINSPSFYNLYKNVIGLTFGEKPIDKDEVEIAQLYGFSESKLKEYFDRPKDTIQELRKEFKVQKSFLTSETSTLKGYEKYRKGVIDTLSNEGINISEKNFDIFFEIYDKLSEIDRTISETAFKYNIMKAIENYMEDTIDINVEEAVIKMYENIINIYEKNQEIDNVSDFFQLDEEE